MLPVKAHVSNMLSRWPSLRTRLCPGCGSPLGKRCTIRRRMHVSLDRCNKLALLKWRFRQDGVRSTNLPQDVQDIVLVRHTSRSDQSVKMASSNCQTCLINPHLRQHNQHLLLYSVRLHAACSISVSSAWWACMEVFTSVLMNSELCIAVVNNILKYVRRQRCLQIYMQCFLSMIYDTKQCRHRYRMKRDECRYTLVFSGLQIQRFVLISDLGLTKNMQLPNTCKTDVDVIVVKHDWFSIGKNNNCSYTPVVWTKKDGNEAQEAKATS